MMIKNDLSFESITGLMNGSIAAIVIHDFYPQNLCMSISEKLTSDFRRGFFLKEIYHPRSDLVNLDSARQSQIEAKRSDRRSPSPSGKGEDEDRFGKVAASPNSPNLTEGGIDSLLFF